MEHYSTVYRQPMICARNNKLLIIKRRVFFIRHGVINFYVDADHKKIAWYYLNIIQAI